ncbi:hypothetical protein M408DRAFT_240039 [Serendipita vermifera MAFF 305830]|uniref:Uncharacterized protein n=1 Tax=Serendipita vermifera MAFF 305830 TaxID=933852 RepID=A0A0C3B4W3_SERVB|nr:hypothetical protein M408DRAFT_240039 [Serendipita vermifera MAFF 305830]
MDTIAPLGMQGLALIVAVNVIVGGFVIGLFFYWRSRRTIHHQLRAIPPPLVPIVEDKPMPQLYQAVVSNGESNLESSSSFPLYLHHSTAHGTTNVFGVGTLIRMPTPKTNLSSETICEHSSELYLGSASLSIQRNRK